MRKINETDFAAYVADGYDLIPLHAYKAEKEKRGVVRKLGKVPRHLNWTSRWYDTKQVIKDCVAANRNAGVRLTSEQLVIDVDPRNGGTEGFDNLCLDFGLDDSKWPCVVTGSGGYHFYLSKPADKPVVDTLRDYPGVEFKSRGRQVVAAGSIHPDTLKRYRWAKDHPTLTKKPPEIPPALLRIIERPQRSAVVGGGQYDQTQIAAMLMGLDPTDYREHSQWLKLMMAVHHASNGDARPEFIDWSIGDPHYNDQAEIIGRRWDSLHREKTDGVTYKSLNRELMLKGRGDLIPTPDASQDFGAYVDDEDASGSDDIDDWLEGDTDKGDGVKHENPGGLDDESVSLLQSLNDTYCIAREQSRVHIIRLDNDPVMKRTYWVRMNQHDFELLHVNRRVMRDTTGLSRSAAPTLPLGKAWLEWAGRKQFDGVTFDPEREHPGYLNLWTGFAYEPSKSGEWSRLQELIHEVLSDGDDKISEYILNWMAWLFQNPGKRAEAALVFRGGMGVGKGTLGNALAHVIGRHALAVNSPEHLIGRFNSHLQDVIFLFADEAIKPYDKVAESRLRAYITEPRLPFEGKGRDVVTSLNLLHLMMASNDSWLVPAGMDERRFLVSDANDKWKGQFSKFEALLAELNKDDGSGYRRMLFDCLRRELPPGWHPRNHPVTKALIDQKLRSMSPLRQFLFNMLYEGALPEFVPTINKGDWSKESVRFFAEHFREAFRDFCQASGISPGGMGRNSLRFLFQEIRQTFADARTELRDSVPDDFDVRRSPSDGRAQSVEFPSLAECRKAFEDALKGPIDWPGDEDNFG